MLLLLVQRQVVPICDCQVPCNLLSLNKGDVSLGALKEPLVVTRIA